MLKFKWRMSKDEASPTPVVPDPVYLPAPERSDITRFARGSEGRVCICTPDYVYLVKNGGIGTAFHHLARTLAGRGFAVTILYTSKLDHVSDLERAEAVAAITREGCAIEFLFADNAEAAERSLLPNDIYTAASYLAYKALAGRDFNTIIFADWRGLAYYSVHAKREGLAFARTKLWVQGHSSSLWHALHNQADGYDPLDIRAFHFERRSIELCDTFLPASAYLAEWNLRHGFVHPADTEVLPLVINEDLHPVSPRSAGSDERRPVKEIVFFGRLEQRKGLQVFLQAVQRLFSRHADTVEACDLTFTFLGKITQIGGMSSVDYIEQHLANLPVRFKLLVSLSSQEAIQYLAANPALAVIASLADNSPMTIHECIYAKVPFIASRAGGIPEIIHPDDHDVLFRPFPDSLADAILKTLASGSKPIRARIDQLGDNIPRWLERLRAPVEHDDAVPKPMPMVTVCVTHYERPAFLAQTLKGLEAQTYREFEVVIVDNGSTSEDAVAYLAAVDRHHPTLSIRRYTLPDLYPGAARNKAIAEAAGEYVLIMDDDNYAHPRQIEIFVKAAVHSGFDALTCGAILVPEDVTCPDETSDFFYLYLPMGSGVSLNLFTNLYGDANGFFRKSALEAIGGYTEERSSWEDYELYSELELSGFKTAVVPEPLMYLRHTIGSVSRTGAMLGNYYRALRPAMKRFPWQTFGDALLISLNESLRGLRAADQGTAGERNEIKIAQESSDPVVVNRLLVRRALQVGRTIEALNQLRGVVDATSTHDVLAWDLYLLAGACNRMDVWRACRAPKTIRTMATLYADALKRSEFAALAESMVALRSTDPDIVYLEGLALLLEGRHVAAFQAWSRMLDVPDAFYLRRNKDIELVLAKGYQRRAYGHYLRFGAAEGRPFSYAPPIKAPFAPVGARAPTSYLTEVAQLYRQPLPEAIAMLSQLLLELVAAGAIVEIADLAEHALDLAEAMYIAVNDDVDAAIKGGSWTKTGLDHWLEEGPAEGRKHLIGSLPRYAVANDRLVLASDLPISVMAREPIQGRPLGDWLRTMSGAAIGGLAEKPDRAL